MIVGDYLHVRWPYHAEINEKSERFSYPRMQFEREKGYLLYVYHNLFIRQKRIAVFSSVRFLV